jgi:tRNA 5-methylaminomethyl-2-thiouridine biosynthesis bifunctional protein
MPDQAPHFDDAGRLIAPDFEDVYFSAEDGLAETRHVFLDGNRLAQRFAELRPGDVFTIGETGFGTGLNFLAAWQLFEQHAPDKARLEFVSVEARPLDTDTMRRALTPWPELTSYAEALLGQWGPMWPGVQRFRLAEGRVGLTVLVGEVAEVLQGTHCAIDAWFLDGFAPSRNPAMWSKDVFNEVAWLSAARATLATYTAAGFVRRGLQAVGFDIEKKPGFGTKREMSVGVRVDTSSDSVDAAAAGDVSARTVAGTSRPVASAVVIGGSLAGSFVAHALADHGVAVTILERQRCVDGELPSLTPRVSVLQPKISDESDPVGQILREGYAVAWRLLASDEALRERCDWRACGTLQASIDERAERRLRRFVEQFGGSGLCEWISRDETQARCGTTLPVGGTWIANAGVLRPAGLCAGLVDRPGITLRDGTAAESLHREGQQWRVVTTDGETMHTDAVVIANAMSAMQFEQTRHLDLRPVRGQVTLLSEKQSGPLASLRCPVFYGGYLLPQLSSKQTLGASFVPGDTDTVWRTNEHEAVCDKLSRVLPEDARRLRSLSDAGGWVGVRVATRHHRPYTQAIEDGLFVSLGHGSHGIASAAYAGRMIAEQCHSLTSNR